MRLTYSQPRSGAKWTDSGKSRERRELKHRQPVTAAWCRFTPSW